jgi:hypothetical protein
VKVGSGWTAGPGGVELSYVFGSFTPKLPASNAQSEIVRALNEWGKYAPLFFHQGTDGSAARTIFIRFAAGAHGDGYAFDGPGNVLAHTFYPSPPNAEPFAGDMHLDADEPWDNQQQIDLYTVALHEAGHALGLGHSDRPGAIMYPYYRAGAQLSNDDIDGIHALYTTITPKPLPLVLLIAIPATSNITVTASTINISGTVSGGTGVGQVTWRTGRGQSGVANGFGNWSITSVPLNEGINTITITCIDSAGTGAARGITATRQAPPPSPVPGPTPPPSPNPTNPPPPAAPPALKITSPSSTIVSTSLARITLRGTASAGATVTWSNSAGGSGTATGSSNWTADVPLQMGTNAITVRAASGSASTWRSITVVRR